MRAGAHRCAGVWQVVAAGDCRLDGQRCYSEQPCAVQRDCVHGCPSPHCRGLCIGRPVCAAGCAAECARLAAGLRGDGGTALILAAMADARDAALVLAACEKEAGQRDTNGFTALMGAVQHRNTDLARLLLRREAGVQKNDGTAAIHIAVFLEDAALVKMLCPYEELQQPMAELPT
ncbi:Ubiquitin-conjugating enzyme E2 [Giardia duodenalis]|uniref:Ubiquitin-conjugating enzyme E2 n=1 Tax=Giardia intestinalis TaxID=5741 RepID=V6TLQ9_GIAIN|nr:Ubiquitin-conjugating enzyme E2 [Giardia intestinalis]